MNLSDVALVTHNNCMDGSTCAAIFIAAGGNRKNVFFTNPGHDDSDELVSDLVERWNGLILIADASISSKLAERIDGENVILLDHHKSAIPLTKFDWCEIEVENQRCGSKMLYDWLVYHGNSVSSYRALVDAVDDHDRWIKNIPDSETVALLHDMLGQELFIERFTKNPFLTLNNQEQYLLKVEEHKKNAYIEKTKKHVTIRTHRVGDNIVKIGYVIAGNYQSALGHAIYDDPELDVDAVVMVGTRSLSLRAKPNSVLDLSAIAKLNGGGGHKSAAGCQLNTVLGGDLLDLVIERLKLE